MVPKCFVYFNFLIFTIIFQTINTDDHKLQLICGEEVMSELLNVDNEPKLVPGISASRALDELPAEDFADYDGCDDEEVIKIV